MTVCVVSAGQGGQGWRRAADFVSRFGAGQRLESIRGE